MGKTPVAPARPRPNHSGCVYGYRDGERESERGTETAGERTENKRGKTDTYNRASRDIIWESE